MEVSTNQEPNKVKQYYNRTRANNQAEKKAKNLKAALASLKPIRGYRTRLRSPLHPARERNEEEEKRLKNLKPKVNTNNDPYNHLTDEERALLNQARGVGGRRTRRHRARRHK